MPLYAAYATSLDPRRMAELAPYSPVAGTGWLIGWRLTFAGGDIDEPVATVVEDELAQVFCALYDMHPTDEASLDTWEGIALGAWNKIRVRVHTLDGEQLAWLYVADAYEGGQPTAMQLARIADAAEAGGAPDDYVTSLRLRPCRGND